MVWAFDQRPKEGENEAVEEGPTLTEDEVVANIKGQLEAALAQDGATKCSALRAVAKECVTGRALFIAAAEAVGINKGTAARQWQEGRAEDGPASNEDRAEMEQGLCDTLYDSGLAMDEVVKLLVPHISSKAIKGIIASFTEK